MYQFTHGGSRYRWTAPVDALRKWLEMWNTDPDISTIFVDTLIYITGEGIDLPQHPNLTIHSDIICIGSPSMILCFISKSLAHTKQTYFTHIGIIKMGFKWASQLITQNRKLIYGQWIHCSKLNHVVEALDDITKEPIPDAEITDEHGQGQDTLPYC